jgi:hypothetical protein
MHDKIEGPKRLPGLWWSPHDDYTVERNEIIGDPRRRGSWPQIIEVDELIGILLGWVFRWGAVPRLEHFESGFDVVGNFNFVCHVVLFT